MEIPFQRSKKIITTVEASTRIDAIASAGFGLSRSKITSQIKQGYLRLNWTKENQPSKGVTNGDLIHLEKKGSLRILNIDKGNLSAGNDADFCIVDLNKPWIVKKENLHSKSKNTSIENKKLQGKVTNTFVKGEELFKL